MTTSAIAHQKIVSSTSWRHHEKYNSQQNDNSPTQGDRP
jgi:hypothetical protein